MINNSPWLWNAFKTAAGMTARTSRGIRILQGKRAKGQSNPSPEYIQSQSVANTLASIYRLIRAAVRYAVTNELTGQTKNNKWYQLNYFSAFNLGSPPSATFIPSEFKISSGVMTSTDIDTLAADESANTITVTWDPAVQDASQATTDIPVFVVFNTSQNKWQQAILTTVDRSDGTATVNPTGSFMVAGNTIHGYLAFVAANGAANEGTSSINGHESAVVAA